MVKHQKNQRKQVARLLLPPLYYWLVSIFVVHLFNIYNFIDLGKILDLWQFNVFIVVVCIVIFIFMAFKDGFMGLRLVTQKSDWDTYMNSVNANAENAIHVLKTHTINMRSSIYLLGIYNKMPGISSEKVSERLDILSRSITYLENYFDRIKYQSQDIRLKDEAWWEVADILRDAGTSVRDIFPGISAVALVAEDDELFCDRVHMTEVFVNIIKNAAEAMHGSGAVEITGLYKKAHKYQLQFKDSGDGIDTDKVSDIFKPHCTTKSKDKNLGLGLSYCRNVVIAHDGRIFVAESARGKGTTIEINFPSRRARTAGGRAGQELTQGVVAEGVPIGASFPSRRARATGGRAGQELTQGVVAEKMEN
jgi:hypothetical protein